jgi:hypothetical protein
VDPSPGNTRRERAQRSPWRSAAERAIRCGQRLRARHPLQTSQATGAAASQLGPDVQALIALMKDKYGLSYGDIQGLLDEAFGISVSRGHDVPEKILGADYDGRLIHDGWSPYDFFRKALHQQCLQHLLRRAEGLLERATRGEPSGGNPHVSLRAGH